MNTDLLIRIGDLIVRHPDKFNMDVLDTLDAKSGPRHANIIGWANRLAKQHKLGSERAFSRALKILDLDSYVGIDLFFPASWPEPYKTVYRDIKSNPLARALVARERILYLVEFKK